MGREGPCFERVRPAAVGRTPTWRPFPRASSVGEPTGDTIGSDQSGPSLDVRSPSDAISTRSSPTASTPKNTDPATPQSVHAAWTGEQFHIDSGKTLHARTDGESWAM